MPRPPCITWLMAFVCGACSVPTGVEDVGPCSHNTHVIVGPGTVPDLTWSPRCRIGHILIEPVERGIGDRWSVFADTNIIAPPVKYGMTLPGTTVRSGPWPLQTGVQYRLVVEVTGPGPWAAIAILTFTP